METRQKWWRSGPPSQSPGVEVLRQLYVSEDLTLEQIGERYGVAKSTVARWLRNASIPTRTAQQAAQIAVPKRRHVYEDPAWQAKARENAAKARESAYTPEARAKMSAAKRGRPAHNKGKQWTAEERAKHMAYRRTAEYREKIAATQRGPRSNLWRGGVSPTEELRLHGWEWRRRRAECYARDKHICQDCGILCVSGHLAREQPTRKIQAHHIVPRRHGGGDELSNLVTLCSTCHGKREAKGRDALFA